MRCHLLCFTVVLKVRSFNSGNNCLPKFRCRELLTLPGKICYKSFTPQLISAICIRVMHNISIVTNLSAKRGIYFSLIRRHTRCPRTGHDRQRRCRESLDAVKSFNIRHLFVLYTQYEADMRDA
ncbi:hypothetical protein F4860DRAFT_331281 [Xylaria cubensis]|nr:hypothetical protein F4860DRAFT_331281 [Xylaria cubensis]